MKANIATRLKCHTLTAPVAASIPRLCLIHVPMHIGWLGHPSATCYGAVQGACSLTHGTLGQLIAKVAPGLALWDAYSGWEDKPLCRCCRGHT
jgi:hypothetical protein